MNLASRRTRKPTFDVCLPLKSRRFGQGFGRSENDPKLSYGLNVHPTRYDTLTTDAHADRRKHARNGLRVIAFIQLSLRDYDQAFEFGQKAMTLGSNNSLAAGVAANVGLYCNRPQEMVVFGVPPV